jgi:hydrophobic/amphiphilic exporter-1 (mainly G- bacteria), HAE1 family
MLFGIIWFAMKSRVRPIVMNTATAMFGILPMAIGLGTGAELQAPLAITVIGGLVSATALTLVVIPVSYDLLEEASERLRAWFGRPAAAPAPPAPVEEREEVTVPELVAGD